MTEGTMLTIVPRSPLRPRSRYTVERVFAYESGARLGDQERGLMAFSGYRHVFDRAPPKSPAPILRFWFPDAAFETGTGPESKRTETLALEEMSVHLDESNCGPGPSVYGRYRVADMAPNDVVALERKDGGILRYFPRKHEFGVDSYGVIRLGNDQCNPDNQVIATTQPWEFRLIIVSASGQRVPAPAWTRARVEGSPSPRPATEPMWSIGGFGETGEREAAGVARWFSTPVREPSTREEPRGPAACPFGLESTGRASLDSPAARTTGWSPVAAVWRSGTLFVVGGLSGPFEPGHLLSRRSRESVAEILLPTPGDVEHAVPSADGFILAMGDRTTAQPPTLARFRAVRLGTDGKPVWRNVFDGPGYNGRGILAWGAQRTLVCWVQAPPGNETSNRILCVVLSSEDGRILRRPFELRTGGAVTQHSLASVNAALAVEGGFLVAWRPSSGRQVAGVSLTRLDQAGNLSENIVLSEAPAGFLDLVRTDRAVVAAWDNNHAGIELAWLGSDGRRANGVASKPLVVGAGTGSTAAWPRLVSRGELVAVAFTAGRSRAFLATADASGAVSPALEVAPGRFPSWPVLAVDGQGFIAVYDLPRAAPQVETFRCREQPLPAAVVGPPQRLPVAP
jgi:hypothetical protein